MGNVAVNVLRANILAGIFIYLVLCVSYVMKRRYSARWKYVMWLMISLFLLFPVNFISDKALIRIEIPQSGESVMEAGESDISQDRVSSADVERTEGQANGNQTISKNEDMADLYAAGMKAESGDNKRIDWNPGAILNGFFIIWVFGIICVMIFRTVSYQVMMKKLRRWAFYVRDKRIRQIYRMVCREKEIKRPPKLMKNAEIGSPLLAGLGTTYLFLPEREYTDDELRLVFSHELTHYKNKDLWYKLFLLAVRTIYWFNPYLYLMGREAEKDVEYICDSCVVSECSRNMRSLYQRLLVSTAAISGSTPCLSASLNDSMKTFKGRLLYMTKVKSMKRGIVPVLVLSVLLVGSNMLVGCSVKESSDDQAAVVSENKEAEPEATKEPEIDEMEEQEDEKAAEVNKENDAANDISEKEEPTSLQAENPDTKNGEVNAASVDSASESEMQIEEHPAVEEKTDAVKAKVKMHEGTYFDEVIYSWAGGEVEPTPYCEFEISNVTDTSFDFAIYQCTENSADRKMIFKKHTAVFTGDGKEAVYNGESYTLHFTFPDERNAFPDVVDMKVSGFGPTEGGTFVNNSIPGHEFG